MSQQDKEQIKTILLKMKEDGHTVSAIIKDALGDCEIIHCGDVNCGSCVLNNTTQGDTSVVSFITDLLMLKEDMIYKEVMAELARADAKYPDDPMSMEELQTSFDTIESELVELRREVHRVKKSPVKMRKEAVQTAAMAIKFLRDVCS